MRYFLLFTIVIFCSKDLMSQNNLQFNKVQTFTGVLGNPPYFASSSSPVWTVPPGKVWKIESMSVPGAEVIGGAVNGNYAGLYFFLNGVPISKSNNGKQPPLPIWLKENDQINFASYSSSDANASYYISILEFNTSQ